MASDSDEFGAFLVGFIVGGLAGAVVSLLFAPQSGKETRALIREKSIDLATMRLNLRKKHWRTPKPRPPKRAPALKN